MFEWLFDLRNQVENQQTGSSPCDECRARRHSSGGNEWTVRYRRQRTRRPARFGRVHIIYDKLEEKGDAKRSHLEYLWRLRSIGLRSTLLLSGRWGTTAPSPFIDRFRALTVPLTDHIHAFIDMRTTLNGRSSWRISLPKVNILSPRRKRKISANWLLRTGSISLTTPAL